MCFFRKKTEPKNEPEPVKHECRFKFDAALTGGAEQYICSCGRLKIKYRRLSEEDLKLLTEQQRETYDFILAVIEHPPFVKVDHWPIGWVVCIIIDHTNAESPALFIDKKGKLILP